MHIYVLARGVKDRLDRWVNDLLARYYPYKYDKDKPAGMVQLAVRPVQLYEIVFPKEAYNEVMSLIKPGDGSKRPREKKFLYALRKILGLKKLPKGWENIPASSYMYREMIGVLGIGMKEDEVDENGIELL